MKKLFKIIAYFFIILIVFIVVLVITASLSQNKIASIALKQVSNTIHAPIEIEDLSFTFIRKFPFATLQFSGVRMGSPLNPDKDIFRIESAYVSVKTMPLFHGQIEIIKIEVDGAQINYSVDSLGTSNIDFLLDTSTVSVEDTSAVDSFPFVDMKKLTLKNITLRYSDDTSKISAHLFIPEIDIKGKLNDQSYAAMLEGDIKLSNCTFDGTNIDRMQETAANFSLHINNDTIRIEKLNITSDGAQMSMVGITLFGNEIFTDLKIQSDGIDLNEMLKYAPNEILSEYGIEKLAGVMQLSGTVKGTVSDSIIPSVNFEFSLANGELITKDYPALKAIAFKSKMSNGEQQTNATTSVSFENLHIETAQSTVDVTLNVNNLDQIRYDLKSKVTINLNEFKDFIPDSIVQNISGTISGEFFTRGVAPDSIDDAFINNALNNSIATVEFKHLNVNTDSLEIKNFSAKMNYKPGQFKVNNLSILVPTYQVNLQNTALDATFLGKLTQPEKLAVFIKTFNVETPQGKLWGSGNFTNMNHPDYKIELNTVLYLDLLKPFVPDSLVKSLSGTFEAKLNSYGRLHLDSVEQQATKILFEQTTMHFDCKNISCIMADTLMQVRNFTGTASMVPDTISISKTSGSALGLDFSLDSVKIINVYNTIFNNLPQKLQVLGNINFGAINHTIFTPLIHLEEADTIPQPETEETISSEPTHYTFEMKGKIGAKSFLYNKAFIDDMCKYLDLSDSLCIMLNSFLMEDVLVKDISAKYKLTDSLYLVDQFIVNAFNGSMNSSLRYRILPDGKSRINLKNEVNKVDIKKFLYDFNSFGQDSLISHENISGLFSATMNSQFIMLNDALVEEDSRIMGDMKLENGGIYNYQPAMDMSKFTGIKELDNIEFKTLESSIFMFKNKMYVPKTNIVSTAMDITAFGMQSMGTDYEYHIQIHLSDVLLGKNKKLLENQAKSGDEVSDDDVDRNAIKLIYAFIDGKSKTWFDTKKAQQNMERKIRTQKTMLDLIFFPTLVSFETEVK